MAIKVCILNPTTSLIDIVDGASAFVGISAAGSPVVLNANGTIDPSFISAITANTLTALAATSLSAQSLVNVYYGTVGSVTAIYARPANAAQAEQYAATGYVIADASQGDTVQVYTSGLVSIPYLGDSGFASTDTGAPVYLSPTDPGNVVKTVSSPNLVQQVGVAYQISTTVNGTVQFQFSSSSLGAVNISLAVPSWQSVSGSPVTGAGTFTITDNTQSANRVFAGPATGSAAAPTFRALVVADLPVSAVTPGSYTLADLTIDAYGRITAATNGVAGDVTSVALAAPTQFSVSGSPITSFGTLTLAWQNQSPNTFLAGPATVSSPPGAAPTFRTLVIADLPAGVGTVTSVGLTMPSEFGVANSPITNSGTFVVTKAAQLPNLVYASPSVTSPPTSPPTSVPVFRSLVPEDLPLATTSTVGAVSVDGTTIMVTGGGEISATGILPLLGIYGTTSPPSSPPSTIVASIDTFGNLVIDGVMTITGATSGTFVRADGTGAANPLPYAVDSVTGITGQTGAYTYTAPALPIGLYRITNYVVVTAVTSSPTLDVTLNYTDDYGAQTSEPYNQTVGQGTYLTGTVVFYNAVASAMPTLVWGFIGTLTYTIEAIVLERLA